MVIIEDSEGRTTYCNRYFYRKTGWRAGDVVGKPWLEHMACADEHPGLREAFDPKKSRVRA